MLEYAQKLASSPGKTDGLYWPTDLNGEISPLGPLLAEAQTKGYRLDVKTPDDSPKPFHGYYFKILTQQGTHAPGGKYSYIINGNMIGGFAMVAWPASYDDTGIMTFIVNQQGRVYQQDLGEETAKTAEAMKDYDPDPNWVRSPDSERRTVMSIAKRLVLLAAVPIIALLSLGIFSRSQFSKIQERSRFVSQTQIPSLAALGDLSRNFAELRVNVRSYLLATNQPEQVRARAAFDGSEAEVSRLLQRYADQLVADDQDRRLLDEYRASSHDWIIGARQVMALATEGRQQEGAAMLNGSMGTISERLRSASSEWIAHNERVAIAAGTSAVAAISQAQWKMLAANCAALIVTAVLGFLTFRRIVKPIRALEKSVRTIAAGDYAQQVPFTHAADETGGLARAVHVLKGGAAEMDQQRWIKTNSSKVTGDVQGANSLAEFGQRLLSGLVPVLGGGVATFYILEENSQKLRMFAAYGLTEKESGPEFFGVGEGLVGQCARELKRVMLTSLPSDYLQITSSVGHASPVQAAAFPLLSHGGLLGVVEVETLASSTRNKRGLSMNYPQIAMGWRVLQRNLRTQDLLTRTQEQAEELTRSQQELLAQQRELTEQREQLKVSEERSRLILESSAEGIFGTDIEGRITFVNPGRLPDARIYRRPNSSGSLLTQLSIITAPTAACIPKEECPMFAAYKQGKTSRIDNELLWRKDGTGLPVEYGAMPMLKDGRSWAR